MFSILVKDSGSWSSVRTKRILVISTDESVVSGENVVSASVCSPCPSQEEHTTTASKTVANGMALNAALNLCSVTRSAHPSASRVGWHAPYRRTFDDLFRILEVRYSLRAALSSVRCRR